MCLLGLLRLPVRHFELLLGRVLIGFSTLRLVELVREKYILNCCTFSSSKISAVWYGLDDHIIFTLGNAIVRSTSLVCRSCCPMVDVKSANGYHPEHAQLVSLTTNAILVRMIVHTSKLKDLF